MLLQAPSNSGTKPHFLPLDSKQKVSEGAMNKR